MEIHTAEGNGPVDESAQPRLTRAGRLGRQASTKSSEATSRGGARRAGADTEPEARVRPTRAEAAEPAGSSEPGGAQEESDDQLRLGSGNDQASKKSSMAR
jgi:hypothetical protein